MTFVVPPTPAWRDAMARLCNAGPCPLIACSGGADSVALAALASTMPQSVEWSPTIVHVNHHLRPDSDADEHHAVHVAETLDLPCRVVHLNPADIVAHPHGTEAGARQLRYDALCLVGEGIGASAVVTAHHAMDRLETALMRLMEGTGIRGLAGPAADTSWCLANDREFPVMRPLLGLWPDELRRWLRELGLTWVEDPSNRDVRFRRNRVRTELVAPVLAMSTPAALARSLSQLAEDCALLEQLIRPHVEQVIVHREPRSVILDRTRLATFDLPLRRAVLLRIAGYVTVERTDARFIADLAARIPEKGRLTLMGHRIRAELTTRRVRLGGTVDPRTPLTGSASAP